MGRGRRCSICEAYRPNEHFRGRGIGKRVCRSCRRLPKAELEVLERERGRERELQGMLRQSLISPNDARRGQPAAPASSPVDGSAADVLWLMRAEEEPWEQFGEHPW